MDQIKLAENLSNDESLAQESGANAGANDVRTLSDLEMVLCGGGEGVVNW